MCRYFKNYRSVFENIKSCQNYKLRYKRPLKLNIIRINEKDKWILNRYSLRFNKQLTYKK